MPVLVIADLHLDLWLQSGRDPLAALPPDLLASLDALIVAGDLSNKPKVRWSHMIRHLARYLPAERIHLLPGNHDFYDHALDDEGRLGVICAQNGASLAQKAEILIGRTRFLSCTLWTDFALHGDPAGAMRIAQRDMNDYRYIRHSGAGFRRIRPQDTALIHADHRLWLENRLSVPFDGRTIVVTHHCAHPGLVSDRPGDLDPVYGSNLLPFIERFQPDAWLFGHTHRRIEVEVGRTLVRNVSLGYPQQVERGSEAKILLRSLVEEQR
jgi:Icc-related predicted phosphoesterase